MLRTLPVSAIADPIYFICPSPFNMLGAELPGRVAIHYGP